MCPTFTMTTFYNYYSICGNNIPCITYSPENQFVNYYNDCAKNNIITYNYIPCNYLSPYYIIYDESNIKDTNSMHNIYENLNDLEEESAKDLNESDKTATDLNDLNESAKTSKDSDNSYVLSEMSDFEMSDFEMSDFEIIDN